MSGFLVNKSLLDPTVTQYSGGTASFTLPQSGSTNATEVFVGGVPQVAGVDFNVSGTALTLTTSAPAGANMVCARQYFADGITGTPASNSVATAAVQDNAINLAKMSGGTDGQIITYDASGDPVAVGPGTDGQVLTSTGAGSPPAFEDAGGGGLIEAPTIFTSSGTYTKNASASRIVVWVVGGGGGGAGVAQSANYATGGGGGGGGTAIETIENSAVGSTETVTVGAAGAQGADGDNDGSAGGTSSFGSHCSATGGAGGISHSSGGGSGVDGGVGSGGDLNISGGDGEGSVDSNSGVTVSSGSGGGSWLGGRSRGMRSQDTHSDGEPGNSYGGGGGGAQDHGNEAHHGGVGSAGIVVVWEYA